jgi:hypothetical protein
MQLRQERGCFWGGREVFSCTLNPTLPLQVAFRRFREAKKRRLLRALRMKREAEREIVEFAPLKLSLFEFGSAMLTGSPSAHRLPRPNLPLAVSPLEWLSLCLCGRKASTAASQAHMFGAL